MCLHKTDFASWKLQINLTLANSRPNPESMVNNPVTKKTHTEHKHSEIQMLLDVFGAMKATTPKQVKKCSFF